MSDKRSFVGVCSATSGCVLHANHAGECRVAEMSEEEYEVEALLKVRSTPHHRPTATRPPWCPPQYTLWLLARTIGD